MMTPVSSHVVLNSSWVEPVLFTLRPSTMMRVALHVSTLVSPRMMLQFEARAQVPVVVSPTQSCSRVDGVRALPPLGCGTTLAVVCLCPVAAAPFPLGLQGLQ